MATVPNGIFGHFTGTIGSVTGYVTNGKNFVRSRPRKSSAPDSPGRLAQQQKMKVCSEFTKPFSGTGFFTKTFPAYGRSGSGVNRATSAILNLAIVGTYPDTAIDYAQVLISKGPLPGAKSALAAVNSDRNIFFTWEDNTGTGSAKANDKVILVAYFPAEKTATFTIGSATRKDGQAMLPLQNMGGEVAETWIGFLSNDEQDAGDSTYSGKVNL